MENLNPTISVIIPVYNSEQYLEDCLNSVVNQSYKAFEAILIDDGSKDHSAIICDDFASMDSRFKVIHKKNEGVAVARNTGLKEARGKWVAFIDSDDTVKPEYLQSMLEVVDENTHFVVCDFYEQEKERIISEHLSASFFIKHQAVFAGAPWNKLFNLQRIKKNNIIFPVGISTMEDNIFVWNYLLICEYVSIMNENNYTYKIRENSLARTKHRIEEMQRLINELAPVYSKLQSFLLSKSLDNLDYYIYSSCLKRLLISNSEGLSFSFIYNVIKESIHTMKPIIMRVAKIKGLQLKDSIIIKLMKNENIFILSLLTKCMNIH